MHTCRFGGQGWTSVLMSSHCVWNWVTGVLLATNGVNWPLKRFSLFRYWETHGSTISGCWTSWAATPSSLWSPHGSWWTSQLSWSAVTWWVGKHREHTLFLTGSKAGALSVSYASVLTLGHLGPLIARSLNTQLCHDSGCAQSKKSSWLPLHFLL